MAKHVKFAAANTVLTPVAAENDTVDDKTKEVIIPSGERISDLDVYMDERQVISCWQLSAEEVMEVIRTGQVYLFVLGHRHPPVFVTGKDPFQTPAVEQINGGEPEPAAEAPAAG